MSKKRSIIIIIIIIVISLAISIYIPNKDKIGIEKEDLSTSYYIVENDGKIGVSKNEEIIIEPQYENIVIPNEHRAVFFCKNEDDQKIVNEKNKEIFTEYENVELIEYEEGKYEKNILRYEKNGKYRIT